MLATQNYSELRINQAFWNREKRTASCLRVRFANFLKGGVLSMTQGSRRGMCIQYMVERPRTLRGLCAVHCDCKCKAGRAQATTICLWISQAVVRVL